MRQQQEQTAVVIKATQHENI